jgi:hypothetical protein
MSGGVMRRGTSLAIITSFVLAVGACAGGLHGGRAQQLDPESDPEAGLVIGYLDGRTVPGGLDYVDLMQIDPPSYRPYWTMRLREGWFYSEGLPPGTYVLHAFGRARRSEYAVGRQESPIQIVVRPAEVQYAGAWRFGDVEHEPLMSLPVPDEREALTELLPFARGTVWQSRIAGRLGLMP